MEWKIKWKKMVKMVLSVFEQQFVMKYVILMSLAAPYSLNIGKGNSLCVSATKHPIGLPSRV